MNEFIENVEYDLSDTAEDDVAYIGGGDLANWGGGGPPAGPCYAMQKYTDNIKYNGVWWKTDCDMFNHCVCKKGVE